MSSVSDLTASKISLYRALAEADEIRILRLEAGHESDEIRCRLHHVKLSDGPVYEAVSYTWGPKLLKAIMLDGQRCHIRANLWQALTHLRRGHSAKILWIDALCINQEDEDERNHQVTQMAQIYSRAVRVLAWLGPASDNSNEAIRALKQTVEDLNPSRDDILGYGRIRGIGLGYYPDPGQRWLPEDQEMEATFYENPRVTSSIRRNRRRVDIDQADIDAIESLCSRGYWQRLWIIQEIHLAKDILLCCGPAQLSWSQFSQSLRAIVQDHKRSAFGESYASSGYYATWRTKASYTLIDDRSSVHIEGSLPHTQFRVPLGRLCRKYGSSGCENYKDRIFGLHAMAPNCCKEATPIDYTAPWVAVWQSVVTHYFIVHKVRPEMVVAISQDLHRNLPLAPNEPNTGLLVGDSSASVGNRRVTIRGTVTHTRLLHVMSLEQLPMEPNPHAFRPEFGTPGRKNHRFHSCLDIIRPFHSPFSHGTITSEHVAARPTSPMTGSTSKIFSADSLCKLFGLSIEETTVLGQSFDLGWCDNGDAYVVPKGSRIGDLLCVFPGSNVIALSRPDSTDVTKYLLVGRCITMASLLMEDSCASFGRSRGSSIVFDVDFPTLHLLTRGPEADAHA